MWVRSSQPAIIRPSISQANMKTSGHHILFMMMTAPQLQVRQLLSKPSVPTAICLPADRFQKCNSWG